MRARYKISIFLLSTSSNEKFSGYDRKRRFTEPNGMIRSCIFSNFCHICSIRPRISIQFAFSTSDSEYSKVTTRINTNSFLVLGFSTPQVQDACTQWHKRKQLFSIAKMLKKFLLFIAGPKPDGAGR